MIYKVAIFDFIASNSSVTGRYFHGYILHYIILLHESMKGMYARYAQSEWFEKYNEKYPTFDLKF